MFLRYDLIEPFEESVELRLDRSSQPVLSNELNILVLVLVSDKNVASIRLEVYNDRLAQLKRNVNMVLIDFGSKQLTFS